MTEYRVVVTASAARQLDRLPEKVTPAIIEFLAGPLADAPTVVGKPLRGPLSGLWSARRGAYRVVYRIDDLTVSVLRVDHRANVYRP